jgi:hypothetical protein
MKKNLESMAMFMICLIITLPVYISSVYADINNIEAYGAKGIKDFVVKEYDLTINAQVTGTPTASDIKLKSGPLYTLFDSCSGSANTSYTCTINLLYGANGGLEICPSTQFMIEQYDGSPYPIDTKAILVKCDSQPPMTSLSLSPQQTDGKEVILSYTITDPKNSATECSGINRIEFYTSVSPSPATLDVNSTGCSYSSSTSIPASSYPDGNVTVYMKVYDKMDQSSITSSSFIIDKTPPSATASVKITDTSGRDLIYFTPQNVLVDVTLNITDLTGISDYRLSYSSLTQTAPTCTVMGSNIICKWNNLPMFMGNASFIKTITLDATDIVGNKGVESIDVQGILTQDSVAPTITISDILINTTDGSVMSWFRPGEMKMSFSAQINDDLSGIKNIQGDFSNLNIINGDTPSCLGSGNSYTCTWSNLRFYMDTASFTKSIGIIADDKAGNSFTQTKTASANFRPDNSGPIITQFSIKSASGRDLDSWIGDETIPVNIYANITDLGSGLESVYGYFNSINPIYTNPIIGNCNQLKGQTSASSTSSQNTDNGVYRGYINPNATNITLPTYNYQCIWDAQIHFNESGNPYPGEFIFNATDKSLNSVQTTITRSFKVDVDGPVVSSLGTTRVWNNTYYAGTGDNTYLAIVSDTGAGINDSNIYLDLTNVGYAANTKANNCSDGYCYWYMASCNSASEGIKMISVTTNSKDYLGNPLKRSFDVNVTVEKTLPSVNSISITPVAASTQLYMDYTQTGNALYIILNITEATSLLSVTGDFSNFISDETHDLADDCTQTNSSWVCVWTTDEIDIISYKKDNIYFNITDVAGNSLIYPYEIEVFEAMTGDVSYWDSVVGASSPNSIDRQIVNLYNPFMWFPISLVSSEGKSADERWPLEVEIVSCFDPSNTEEGSTSSANYLLSSNGNLPLMINPNTQNPTSLPYNMHFNYELEQSAPATGSLTIACSLKIRTLVDRKKISPYEMENVTVTIDYYNNPLGTLDSNIQSEIDAVKDGWLVKAEWIGQISDIMEKLGRICGLIDKLIKLNYVISGLSDALAGIAWTKPLSVGMGTVANGLNTMTGSFWGFVNKFCKFLNCQLFYGVDWGGGESGGPLSGDGWYSDTQRHISKNSRWWNPKDSLLLSIFTLCLPGVLYNLQKARAIDCQYIMCLKSTAAGMPLQMCVKQRDYSWCSYVYGQVFQTLPFNFLYNIAKQIKEMLANPAQAISVIVKGACTKCSDTSGLCLICITLSSLDTLLDVLCDFGIGADHCEPFWEDLTVDDSACEAALKG